MKNRLLFALFALGLSATAVLAQRTPSPTIRWVRFEQLDSLQQRQARPVFIYLHTSWCGYCQLFGSTTLRHTDVIQRLNEQFYCVDFDAESRHPVVFRGHTYPFQPTGIGTGQHALATYLTQPYADTGYPSLLFHDAAFRPITAAFSALPSRQFLLLLAEVAAQRR